MKQIENILSGFSPITLQEMDEVKLLNRTDTKFVLPQTLFEEILPLLDANYKVLEIDHKRMAEYRTLYFDTPDFMFYHHHHNGRPNRYKVRMRKYVDSDLCFLEIKNKKKGRTIKSRIRIDDFEINLSGESCQFIKEIIPHNYHLDTALWNFFHRITLVNKYDTERLTLDLGLGFSPVIKQPASKGKGEEDENVFMGNVIIAEVKQERVNRQSPFIALLKRNGVRPMRMSKYCMGAGLLFEHLKTNRFKSKYLHLNKLNQ